MDQEQIGAQNESPEQSQRHDDLPGLGSYVDGVRDEFESKLGALVEIPTVSMDPDRKSDIRKGAELARQYLESVGAAAEIVETPGNPVVFGKITKSENCNTITVYNHIDVQPADPAEWHRAPFTF